MSRSSRHSCWHSPLLKLFLYSQYKWPAQTGLVSRFLGIDRSPAISFFVGARSETVSNERGPSSDCCFQPSAQMVVHCRWRVSGFFLFLNSSFTVQISPGDTWSIHAMGSPYVTVYPKVGLDVTRIHPTGTPPQCTAPRATCSVGCSVGWSSNKCLTSSNKKLFKLI